MPLSKVKFSVPLWPGLQPAEITDAVIPALIESRECISDIYVTTRIAPFTSDAMGGLFVDDEEMTAILNAIIVSDATGIPLSATFNDCTVSPSKANYDIFVKQFRDLYDGGIRRVTIPHTAWLGFGLKKEFPDLFVKNTILNKVYAPAEGAALFEAGFDYINLDRNLVRNEAMLIEWRLMTNRLKHKLGRDLQLSLLYNENCLAHCPMQADHFAYNLRRTHDDPAFFMSELACHAPCENNNDDQLLWHLKAASVLPFYSELSRLSAYADCFKLHGREDRGVFYHSLGTLVSFIRRGDIKQFPLSMLYQLDRDGELGGWLELTKNCRFNCWSCSACDVLANKVGTGSRI